MGARRVVSLGMLLALLLGAPSAHAEAPAPGDGYRISVITVGPGDSLVTLYGHTALLVERTGLPALVYNFGMYTEAAIAPHHILGGTLRYFLDVDYPGRTVAGYREQNRSVSVQALSLERDTAEKLALALSENSRPENSTYAYDFARDNCTTRVRDALDRALGGALRAQMRGGAPLTYRDHALRFAADDLVFYFLLDLGLGKSVDRPLDAWDDAFLPDRLAAQLRRIRVAEASGSPALVARESTVFDSGRAPREKPPARAAWHAFAGTALGALLFALGRRTGHLARLLLGLGSLLIGALVGVLGLWVLLLLLTNVHGASHDNFNLLVCPPWALGMVWGGLFVALDRPSGPRVLARRAGESLTIAGAGVLLATLFGQDSLRVALLVVPVLLGVWLGARATLRQGAGVGSGGSATPPS